MAKQKSFFGTLVKLGTIAAATALVYSRREEIRGFLNDLAGRCVPEENEPEMDYPEFEPEIIIDATAAEKEQKAEEQTEE